ncbi:MAG: CoA transferase [Actinomycetota bacterium]|nr:CoA transferase [Actinomycetota bacterium]
MANPEMENNGPLKGIKVVDMTINMAGPTCSLYLADLGADVIKIEHPTSRGVAVSPPDPDAELDPWTKGELPPVSIRNGVFPDGDPGEDWWNRMGYFNKMNRSKRSLCLDIKAPGGRDVLERLVASADIVINNYSPRGVRSLGIDHETLRAIKPDVVTVAMSGFGATGPGAEAVSWGPILDAASGLAATTGYADSGPFKQGVAYPDPVGGTHGAAAVLAAWWEHQRTGEPVHVDLSQLETLLFVAGDQLVEASVKGAAPPRRGARSADYAPAGVYRCAGTDTWLALTVYDEADWARLVGVVPGLADERWGMAAQRHHDHDDIDALIEAWTSRHDPRQAMSQLQGAGLSAAIVSTSSDLVDDPQLNDRGFFVDLTHSSYGPRRFPGSAILIDGVPLLVRPLSSLGADNDLVLESLGFGAAERDGLRASGTIAARPPT